MKVDVTMTVNAPADKVWQILGPGFGDISDWCATVNASRLTDRRTGPGDAPATGRHCDTTFGAFDETFDAYDADAKSMEYEAKSTKLPFFIKRLANRFTVEALDDKRSRVTMNSSADMSQPFKFLMGGMMKMSMGKSLRGLVEELKHFAEHDAPHPRKVKAQAKAAKKAMA